MNGGDEPDRAQDPRVGAYPLADEANKWGLWKDAFAQHRAEARQFPDPETRTAWCQPYFRTILEEYWYIWKHDKEFLEFYKSFGSVDNMYDGHEPNVAEMGLILSRLKDVISRNRRLWGYDRTSQDTPPRRILTKTRQGNGSH